jgi:hypothetical protein
MKKGHFIFMPGTVIKYRNPAPPIFGKGGQEERHGILFTRSYYGLMGSLETSDLFKDHVEMFCRGT